MAGYKSAALDPVKNDPQTTVKWREAPYPAPENALTGMLYECFPALGPLVVLDPDFAFFAGTGARRGTAYPGLAGTEIDRADPIAGTPANLQVVAHSPVRCGGGKPTYADFTYYTVPSGAGVVAVGTMLWARALRGSDPKVGLTEASSRFAGAVTDNVLRAMAAGPLGAVYPARGNLASLGARASTTTGTGGSVAR
jgi:hypothetical protein